MSLNQKKPDTQNVWFIHTMEYYTTVKKQGHHEWCRQMDETRKHAERHNTPEGHAWYIRTDK